MSVEISYCFIREQEEEIEHELAAEPTFGELHQARADGSLRVYRRQNQGQKFRRANKNRFYMSLFLKAFNFYSDIFFDVRELLMVVVCVCEGQWSLVQRCL